MTTKQDCITNCLDCHSVCLSTISHCLRLGAAHAEPQHIRLLQDCAQICIVSADFMLRGSPFHQLVCEICGAICDKCADDCVRLAGDETMVLCVETCRRCASSCAEMGTTELKAA